MLTPAQAAFLAALPQRPSAFNPLKNIASARARQQTVLRRMAAAGTLSPERLREARAEQVALRPRTRRVQRAAFRRDGVRLRQGYGGQAARQARTADRHDARSRSPARGRRHHRARARVAEGARRRERRGRRPRQRARRVAGVGRIGQLRRRGAWRRDQRAAGAAAARIGAEAVHLRARVRAGAQSRERAPRHPVALSDGGAGRALQPAQLRRAVPRSAPGAPRAGRLRRTCPRSRSRPTSA